MADTRTQFSFDQDAYSKIGCLIGLLEMWQRGDGRPDYLEALLTESNDWLDEVRKTSNPIFVNRREESAQDMSVFQLFISRSFSAICPDEERYKLEALLTEAEKIVSRYTLGGRPVSQRDSTLKF